VVKTAISQPRFLPATNYLQRIYNVDNFVFLDNVQHQRRGFEHRNKIANGNQVEWASLEVDRSDTSRPMICNMHIKSLESVLSIYSQCKRYYEASPFFSDRVLRSLLCIDDPFDNHFQSYTCSCIAKIFKELEIEMDWRQRLHFATVLCADKVATGPKNLVNLCSALGTSIYVTGPNARQYLTSESWQTDVAVRYHDYCYPEYSRGQYRSVKWLGYLDMLFWAGPNFLRKQITAPIILLSPN